MLIRAIVSLILVGITSSTALNITSGVIDACPGYVAENIKTTQATLTADLVLGDKACNVYGADLERLKLSVVYEDGRHYLATFSEEQLSNRPLNLSF